jgi:choline dehydrogenase-like flavoprotein
MQFSAANRAESVIIQQRGTPDSGGATRTVSARKEIILSAGWLHTPQILQRSGIGQSALLSQAGISVRVDLPGVGANLQDHSSSSITYQCEPPSSDCGREYALRVNHAM